MYMAVSANLNVLGKAVSDKSNTVHIPKMSVLTV